MIRLSDGAADRMAGALAAACDAAQAPGTVTFYSGAMPATPNTATRETALARFALDRPSFNIARRGIVAARPVADTTALATGRVGWARIADGDGRTVLDCDVGEMDGAEVIKLNIRNLVQGGPVTLDALSFAMPRA